MYDELISAKIVQSGTFVLKNGQISNIYFDCRKLVSYPDLMMKIAEKASFYCSQKKFDKTFGLCGVPLGGIPLTVVMSIKFNIPALFLRPESKSHGTGNLIEGNTDVIKNVYLIEDVITTGNSVKKTVEILNENGINVIGIICILNRGHIATINDIPIISLLNMDTLLLHLSTKMDLHSRKKLFINPVAHRLIDIMLEKKSNTCLAIDLTDANKILEIADKLGPFICILKTHVDIITNFTDEFITNLQQLAEKHNFLIFEDRKFADISNTIHLQYTGGIYKISNWAHIVNAHPISGTDTITGLGQFMKNRTDKCLLLVSEMSTSDNLIDTNYRNKTIEMANKFPEFVVGFIGQNGVSSNFLTMCPGISINSIDGKYDIGNQTYNSPVDAILKRNCDIIIVGRSIINSDNMIETMQECQIQGWKAYLRKIN